METRLYWKCNRSVTDGPSVWQQDFVLHVSVSFFFFFFFWGGRGGIIVNAWPWHAATAVFKVVDFKTSRTEALDCCECIMWLYSAGPGSGMLQFYADPKRLYCINCVRIRCLCFSWLPPACFVLQSRRQSFSLFITEWKWDSSRDPWVKVGISFFCVTFPVCECVEWILPFC